MVVTLPVPTLLPQEELFGVVINLYEFKDIGIARGVARRPTKTKKRGAKVSLGLPQIA